MKFVSDNGKIINFSPLTGYIITNAQGLTANVIDMATSQGVTQIGTTVQGESVQDKTLVFEGALMGRATGMRKHMLDTIVPIVGGTLIFDNRLEMRVRPQITPDIERYADNPRFQFTVRASYPYWRAIEQTVVDVAGMEPRFKFPINYGDTYFENPLTHMFGERTQSYFRNVINTGNVAAPFRVLFFANTALSTPDITLVNDELPFLRINKNMVAGERIIIDMLGDSIKVTNDVFGMISNAFPYFDIDSTPFKLEPGDNLIRYDAVSNRDGLDVRLNFPPTFSAAYGDDETFV